MRARRRPRRTRFVTRQVYRRIITNKNKIEWVDRGAQIIYRNYKNVNDDEDDDRRITTQSRTRGVRGRDSSVPPNRDRTQTHAHRIMIYHPAI